MNFLQTLRNRLWFARLALLWFSLTLGVAAASPLFAPASVVTVCRTAGVARIAVDTDGTTTPNAHGLHCPLCAPGGAPPSIPGALPAAVRPMEPAPSYFVDVELPARPAFSPLPRGPPVVVPAV